MSLQSATALLWCRCDCRDGICFQAAVALPCSCRASQLTCGLQVEPDGRPVKHQVFASGWLQNEGQLGKQSFWGRPVGLLVLPDGSLLVSDDTAEVVYRISYHG